MRQSQKTFAVSASTEPILQAQPLTSKSANCSWHPKPPLRSGQKRKHETITVDQNEGGDSRCLSELRLTTADPEIKSSLFDVRSQRCWRGVKKRAMVLCQDAARYWLNCQCQVAIRQMERKLQNRYSSGLTKAIHRGLEVKNPSRRY